MIQWLSGSLDTAFYWFWTFGPKTIRIWTQITSFVVTCRRKRVICQHEMSTVWSSAWLAYDLGCSSQSLTEPLHVKVNGNHLEHVLTVSVVFFSSLLDFLSEFQVFHCRFSHIWSAILQGIVNLHETCVMEMWWGLKHILLQLYYCVTISKLVQDQRSYS